MDYDDSINALVHLMSRHAGREHYNEDNPGFGIRKKLDNFDVGGGAYRNSIDKPSLYAGLWKTLYNQGPVSLNVGGGVVSGYNNSVMPFISPEVVVDVDGTKKIVLNYMPGIKTDNFKSPNTFGVSVKFPFK